MKIRCKNISGFFPLCLLIIALGAGCRTTSFVRSDFAARTKALTNLVVMPVSAAAVEYQANGIKWNPFLQEGAICQQLRTLIARQYQVRGFKVVQSKLATSSGTVITNDISRDREMWMQLQVQRAYQTLVRIGGYARGNVVRPEVPLLSDYEKADGLVFINASVVTESSEARNERFAYNAVAITVGLGATLLSGSSTVPFLEGSPEGGSLEVILVEGRTGEVLWRSWTYTDLPDRQWLGPAVQEVFSDYPDQRRYR